jgi:hypothetical protein
MLENYALLQLDVTDNENNSRGGATITLLNWMVH